MVIKYLAVQKCWTTFSDQYVTSRVDDIISTGTKTWHTTTAGPIHLSHQGRNQYYNLNISHWSCCWGPYIQEWWWWGLLLLYLCRTGSFLLLLGTRNRWHIIRQQQLLQCLVMSKPPRGGIFSKTSTSPQAPFKL